MKTRKRRPACYVALLVALGGCGGNVNLGGKGAAGSGSHETGGAPTVAGDPDLVASEPVAALAESFSLGTLAVAGDFLYFSGVGAKEAGELHRCLKSNCNATQERLQSVSGTVASLQAFGQRLGVANYASGSYWLGSYALPDASDPQIAIRDLPGSGSIASHFLAGFLYFALPVDSGVYRCVLPDCPNGPERIGRARAAPLQIDLSADGEHVFWTDRTLIYRAGDHGQEPARALLPDEQLSEAPDAVITDEREPTERVEAMAAGDGALYAALSRPETGTPCSPFCPQRIVRWPTGGGPREELVTADSMLQRVLVFDGELVWVSLPLQPTNVTMATLSTCRVEACDTTRRDLGKVSPNPNGLVADERDLYWLEAEITVPGSDQPTRLIERQIRRAPRLSPP